MLIARAIIKGASWRALRFTTNLSVAVTDSSSSLSSSYSSEMVSGVVNNSMKIDPARAIAVIIQKKSLNFKVGII